MKIRHGFVSNSSSSSFIVHKKSLSEFQINAIHNHIEVYNSLNPDYPADKDEEWFIDDKGGAILGSTSMDNFDMESFFNLIGIHSCCYEFEKD